MCHSRGQSQESLHLIIQDWWCPLSILCCLIQHSTSEGAARHHSSEHWFCYVLQHLSTPPCHFSWHPSMQKPEKKWCKGSSKTWELEGAGHICSVYLYAFFFHFLDDSAFIGTMFIKIQITNTCITAMWTKQIKHNILWVQKEQGLLPSPCVDYAPSLDVCRSQVIFLVCCHLPELRAGKSEATPM